MNYKTETNYILELLKCAVTENVPSAPPEDIDWDKFLLIAGKHKIASTLYFGMQKLSKQQQESIKYFQKYVFAYKKTLVLDANRAYELDILKNALEKCNIDYILLKGSVTKYLYPDTSMRVMSDIDILFKGSDFNVINKIFFENGYNTYQKAPKEVSYFKPSNKIKVEMQTQLMDEGYDVWFQYLTNIWERCVPCGKSHEYKMTDEDFYLYHIIHMAKHFKNGGIGLTHVLDVWIILNSYTALNYKYVRKELKSLGLELFEKNLRLLTDFWFGDYQPEPEISQTLDLLGNYVFNSGAFGQKKQKETNDIVARNDTKRLWRKKIFPDTATMVNYYGSILKKHSWLIPFYWIRLNFKRIFIERKELRSNINRMNNITDKRIERTKELMKRCGL